jgi:hypothetical protein
MVSKNRSAVLKLAGLLVSGCISEYCAAGLPMLVPDHDATRVRCFSDDSEVEMILILGRSAIRAPGPLCAEAGQGTAAPCPTRLFSPRPSFLRSRQCSQASSRISSMVTGAGFFVDVIASPDFPEKTRTQHRARAAVADRQRPNFKLPVRLSCLLAGTLTRS